MVWKAKRAPTVAEVKHAVELLKVWKLGIIEEDGHIQYRGDWHPNYNGPGTHHGVEVWTDIPEDQYGYKGEPLATKKTTTDAERELVLAEGEERGYPADELNAVIQVESGWNPAARNPVSNASGLIQFMPFTLKNLGWTGTPEEFRELSSGEQAPWVGSYFDMVGANRWRFPGDTYLAVAAPGYIGASDSTVVYAQGTKAWEQNPGWRPADGGDITAGSIRAVMLRKMGSMPPLVTRRTKAPAVSFSWVASLWRWLRGVWWR
jgi:hypothetical protein